MPKVYFDPLAQPGFCDEGGEVEKDIIYLTIRCNTGADPERFGGVDEILNQLEC